MLIATGLTRLVPWYLKLAIDAISHATDRNRLVAYIAGMLGVAAVGALFMYAKRWLIRSTARRVEFDIREHLFRHVHGLDMGFFNQHQTGNLMAHFTNDLNAVRMVAGPGIMNALSTGTMLIMSLGAMAALSPRLTLLAFTPYPLISVLTFFFGRALHRRLRRVQDLFGDLSSRVQEDLAGVRVVRAYGQERACTEKFVGLSTTYMEANLAVARIRGRFMAVTSILAGAGLATTLWVGGGQVIQGTLSLGALVAFSAYLTELTWPVISIGWLMGLFQRGASAAARLSEVLNASPAVVSGPVGSPPTPSVAFEGVGFRYPGAKEDALCDISFHIAPGQTLGIVGPTGSGKSTVFHLIERFSDPASGRVLVGGLDAREIDLSAVRAFIGYAPQDALVFSRSIQDNIRYGKKDASPEEIATAARNVCLDREIAALEDGYAALVGERGITLSGGQRQRLCLARALITSPRILLLDDTLSNVDAQTERDILAVLKKYTAHRTTIIASHRISAVRHADQILVLDQGRAVEVGTHEALLAKGGWYARVYEKQRLADEIERGGF